MLSNDFNLKGKKLLILGGGFLHIQLVQAAKELGMITYVTDSASVVQSPAKLYADHYYDYDIYDIERLEDLCTKEHIDGAIVGYFHAPYAPYLELCKRMNYYCLCNERQFSLFMMKDAFAKMCEDCGIAIPKKYKECELTKDFKQYPIIVKPVDSRGSKGQSVCNCYEEVLPAIQYAKDNSDRREVIIEEYLSSKKELTLELAIKDGEIYPIAILDMYYGLDESGTGRIYRVVTTSKVSFKYYENELKPQLMRLIKYADMTNGICSIQGKLDNGIFKMYDANVRCCGNVFSVFTTAENGFSSAKMLAEYAVTGNLKLDTKNKLYELQGKVPVIWYIALKEGTIARIEGLDEVIKDSHCLAYEKRLEVGDTVMATQDSRQLLGAVYLLFTSSDEANSYMPNILESVFVFDSIGNAMVINEL